MIAAGDVSIKGVGLRHRAPEKEPLAPTLPPPFHAWDQPFGGYQRGTLEGVRRRLDYLQGLGVGAIWLTPVLQNPPWADGSFHGYGIQHFLRVNPRLASDPANAEAELSALIDEAHARGIYVIFDIVLTRISQRAQTARVASGGRIHPESCRLIW